MRLAFVLHHYFPYGGLQRDALRIAEVCREQGHQVEFLTMQWQGPPLQGVPIKLFPQTHLSNINRAKAFSKAIQKYIQQHPYDGIVGFNKMSGLDIYYAADLCFAALLHKRRFHLVYKLLPRYRYLLNMEAQVMAEKSKTHILCISPQAMKDFQYYYHIPKERLHFLSPGISRDRCWQPNAIARRVKMREHLGIAPDKKIVLMLGSAFKTKGVDRGMQAFACLPAGIKKNIELFIVGKGDQKPFLCLAKQLQIEKQVHFILGSDEIPELLLAADLLLHPAYVENTGTVILEAIVAGLPVLTTENCGYAFYVEQAQAGIVLEEPFIQERLNQQLNYMLMASEYEQWQKNAVQFGQEHDLYSMPEKAVQSIKEIIGSKTEYTFSGLMQKEGRIYRQIKRRKTIRFEKYGEIYFAKLFWGVGLVEFIKNLIRGQCPIVDASHEKYALEKLNSVGVNVPKIVAYDCSGMNPLKRQSFIVMKAIEPAISLEDYLYEWERKPLNIRRALIKHVAQFAKKIHDLGVQHRDFYICHFLLNIPQGEEKLTPENIELTVIDWHRARFKLPFPHSWQVKDLSALYFSVLSASLTRRDFFRFLRVYTNKPLREIFVDSIWKKVEKKSLHLYQKTFSTLPESYVPLLSTKDNFLIQKNSRKKIMIRKDSITPELIRVLGDPDSIFTRDKTLILADNKLATLARVKVGDRELVIKRYRWRDGWSGFSRLFRPTRAERCWNFAHILEKHGILTPKPIALVEKRWGYFRRDSYYITEYCSAPSLREVIHQTRDPAVLKQLWEQWQQLHKSLTAARLSHGDTNHQNFLVTEQGLIVLDLDTMRHHFFSHRLSRKCKKDDQRFLREWIRQTENKK